MVASSFNNSFKALRLSDNFPIRKELVTTASGMQQLARDSGRK